jgi:hypothetical protein
MLARSLHLLHYRRAAGIVAHAALFPGNRSYSNNRNDSDDKQIQVAAQQPRAGFSPLDLTAKLESVLAKTLKIIDSKFAVPPPPPAIPLPEEGKNRSLDLLKSALTLGFDDDHTKSELTHKPAPTTRIPVQSQHNAAQAKLKPSASSLLHVYSVNVQKRLSQDLGEAEGRLRATDLAAKTLIGLADLRDALDAQDIALLPRDLRFQHVLRELGEPFYLSDRGLVASLAAAERLQLESLARLLVTLEKVCAQLASCLACALTLDSRGFSFLCPLTCSLAYARRRSCCRGWAGETRGVWWGYTPC